MTVIAQGEISVEAPGVTAASVMIRNLQFAVYGSAGLQTIVTLASPWLDPPPPSVLAALIRLVTSSLVAANFLLVGMGLRWAQEKLELPFKVSMTGTARRAEEIN